MAKPITTNDSTSVQVNSFLGAKFGHFRFLQKIVLVLCGDEQKYICPSLFTGSALWEEIWGKLTQLRLLLVAWLHLWDASLTFFLNTWLVAPRYMTHIDSCSMFYCSQMVFITSVGTHTYVTVGRGGLSTFRGSKSWPMFKKCKY